jgi:FtsP/CotA-like multicopper oxidase with cupredoxin domain
MKKKLLFAFLLCASSLHAQIDYTKLIVGRNTGTKTFFDGTSTRIFGFTESLSAVVKLPSPTIYIEEGDSVMIDFWNVSQGAPHTIHLHGLDVNMANDGVGMFSFEVGHMEHGYYRFKAPHPGTYLYHCHVASVIHVQAGMYGVVVVRPSDGNPLLNWTGGEAYDHEWIWTGSEIDTVWHNNLYLNHEHDTLNPMEPIPIPDQYLPQYYMVNGLSDTQLSDPANYFYGPENGKAYARISNLGYLGERYIFPPALLARTVASDGRPLPQAVISDTVVLFPGERFETFLQLGSNTLYPVNVEYFNLNTGEVANTQTLYIKASGVGLEEAKVTVPTIFPNPSMDGVFYASEPFEEAYILSDLSGRVLRRDQGQCIDLKDQPAGVYLLQYRGNVERLLIP